METIRMTQRRKVGVNPFMDSVMAEKQHVDLNEFLKGTISGKELVKYVCDRLDEKYNG